LPFTLPRQVGQVPIHHGYLDMPSTPLFPFGHGLSYTTFEYSPLEVEKDTVDVGGEAKVSLTVTNIGKLHGTEIVQRGRHGYRRDAARAAACRVRPGGPGAWRVEDRHVRRADERARR
jgi:hypothetical protein